MTWVRSGNAGGMKQQVFTVRMTASGTTFTDDVGPSFPPGYVVGLEAKEVSGVSDTSLDITLKDENGVDTLNGAGLALDISSAAKFVQPEDGNGNGTLRPFKGALTLGIANNADSGSVIDFTIYLAFPR